MLIGENQTDTATRSSSRDEDDAVVAAFVRARPRRPLGPRLGRLRASAKLAAGRPLLQDEPISLDYAFVADLLLRVLRARAERGEAGAAVAVQTMSRGGQDLRRIADEAFVGHHDHLEQLTRPLGPAQIALLAACEVAVRPLLALAAAALSDHLARSDWRRPYCPICGTAGTLIDSDTLTCPRCSTGWRAPYNSEHPGVRLELELVGSGEDQAWHDD